MRPGNGLVETTADLAADRSASANPGRDAAGAIDPVTGAALERTVRAVSVQRCSLGVGRVIDRGPYRIQTVYRLVAALTTDALMAERVAHQPRLRRVVERREEVDVATLLRVRRLMTVRAVGLARCQPVVAAVGGRAEGH